MCHMFARVGGCEGGRGFELHKMPGYGQVQNVRRGRTEGAILLGDRAQRRDAMFRYEKDKGGRV
jgi:hypothetical protein